MPLTGRIFNIQKFSLNDGPGIRTTVFFRGCPLRCGWCSNPESQTRNTSAADRTNDPRYTGKEYTAGEILEIVCQDRVFYEGSGGGMTLSGGEVLLQADFAAELIRAAHAGGIHTAVETSGYLAPERFRQFFPLPDLFLFDVKHYDPALHLEGTGVDNRVILENLRSIIEAGKPVIARIPVIPRFSLGIVHARGFAALLTDLGIREVHLLPFHQFGEGKYGTLGIDYAWKGIPQLHPELLDRYRQVFLDAGLDCSIR